MSTVKINKSVIVRLYEEGLNQANFDQVTRELIANDAIMHNIPYGDQKGPELICAIWSALHNAFSDLHFKLEHILAESNQVAVRGVTTGTHSGTFAGHAPTGRRVSERVHVFYRLEVGRVQEIWPMVDRTGLLQQLERD
jgi:predicted ester cyclase